MGERKQWLELTSRTFVEIANSYTSIYSIDLFYSHQWQVTLNETINFNKSHAGQLNHLKKIRNKRQNKLYFCYTTLHVSSAQVSLSVLCMSKLPTLLTFLIDRIDRKKNKGCKCGSLLSYHTSQCSVQCVLACFDIVSLYVCFISDRMYRRTSNMAGLSCPPHVITVLKVLICFCVCVNV